MIHVAGAFLLATVFAWSGVAKMRRPALAAFAMVDFGVIRRPRAAYGLTLAGVELVVAAALVTRWSSRIGATAAAVLLIVFTSLIARSLWQGDVFPCFCFGDSGSALSRLTLLRTAVLTLVAVGVAAAEWATTATPNAKEILVSAVSAVALLASVLLASAGAALRQQKRRVVPVRGGGMLHDGI